jgi:hypothetical protein
MTQLGEVMSTDFAHARRGRDRAAPSVRRADLIASAAAFGCGLRTLR